MTVAVEEGAAEVEEDVGDEDEVRVAPAASAETWRSLRKEGGQLGESEGKVWRTHEALAAASVALAVREATEDV